MSIGLLFRSLPASQFILRCAAWVVPGRERAEWLAEWQAELWQAWQVYRRPCRGRFCGGQEVTDFCLGAFRDAFWLRCNNPHSIPRRLLRVGSASRCSLCLAMWTAISLVVCLCLPGADKAMRSSAYRNADGLVTISSGGYSGAQSPTIRFADYRSWRTSAQHLFTGMAFYQPMLKRVHIGRHKGIELSIGRSSDNLFQLLNLPFSPGAGDSADGRFSARLFLSQSAWRGLFGGDTRMIGSVTEIAGQPVLIAGVVSQDSWQLPGQVDAWLLEDEQHLARLPLNSKGFVLAHLRTSGYLPPLEGWRTMTVSREDRSYDRFDCISLAQRAQLPFSIFLFTLIVAIIALPATTALPLGEYPRHNGRFPWAVRGRRWFFLWSKFVLLLPLVYLASIDAAYGAYPVSSTNAQYIQLTTSFFGFLFGFRWILQDQRKRCPVCLRVLSNPARVGLASRNFLAWNGTELICAGGHGLLHIPEIPTSWFGTQRWLYLDPSWGSLFSDACIPSTGFV
jgi:hypothetical protein